jgi:hypothetical protein
MFILLGKLDFMDIHQSVEKYLSSSKTIIQVSFLVLINLQNHCFVFIIALGIEYSVKESEYNFHLALNIGSVGTKNGNL